MEESPAGSLVGIEALNSLRELEGKLDSASSELNTSSDKLIEKVIQLVEDNQTFSREIGKKYVPSSITFDLDNQLLNKVLQLKSENKLLNQDLSKLKSKSLRSTITDITDIIIEVAGCSLIVNKLIN